MPPGLWCKPPCAVRWSRGWRSGSPMILSRYSNVFVRWGLAAMAASLATFLAPPAPAQTFPERTVKLIVPVPPGGSTDAIARMVTLRMQAILGQPVIIENQPGAGGLIAARAVAAANPDGYTLLIGGIGTLSIGPSAKTPDFNAATTFTPIGT